MSMSLRIGLAAACLCMSLPCNRVSAQRGQLIEGLFRTLAETQIERERQKRAEAERLAREQAETPPSKNPYEVHLPSGFGTKPTFNRPAPNSTPQVNPNTISINVRSREAAEYAANLVKFNQQFAPLVAELRTASTAHPQLRGLLPEAYAIAADGRAILQNCDGISSLGPIIDSYRELDTRYRQLSFNLQAIPGLSRQCTRAIQQCDELCAAMGKQLNIQPQYDRHALHDVMMMAATYMQALSDDLQIAVVSENQCQRLTHDLRLLRQQLITEAGRVDQTSYDEMVERYAQFIGPWRVFSNQVYTINNPHLNRRLDRISECGEQTYHLLRMQPPVSAQDLIATSLRLQQNLEVVMGQLNYSHPGCFETRRPTSRPQIMSRPVRAIRSPAHAV